MNIFDFKDYKTFIAQYLEKLPSGTRGELGRIAKYIRVHQSLLSQVIRGDKNLTLEQALNICEYFEFDEKETDYFITLIQVQRSGTKQLEKYWKKKSHQIKEVATDLSQKLDYEKTLTEQERAIFYSNWYYSAIRLSCSLKNVNTIEDISEHLGLPRKLVKEVIEFLLRTGLCEKKRNKLNLGPARTYLERDSEFIQQHHRNWRLYAMKRQDFLSHNELCFSGPLSIDKDGFEKIKNVLSDTIKDVSESVKKSNPETLACLNIDWFLLH